MKLGYQESINLASEFIKRYKARNDLDVLLCPSADALGAVGEVLNKSDFSLGAQNVFYHDKGSYTGEISPAVVRELGCQYVLIGHSERRKLGETDDDVNRKVQAVLKNDMAPIVCVGETLEEFQEKKTDVVVIRQVTKALEDVKMKEGQKLIIAYEPVWVIGSGQAVEHSIVEYMVQLIIRTAADMDPSVADKFQLVYGGSVDAGNVNDFIIGNLSTGVIVGSESLEAKSFLSILESIE